MRKAARKGRPTLTPHADVLAKALGNPEARALYERRKLGHIAAVADDKAEAHAALVAAGLVDGYERKPKRHRKRC